MKTKAEALREGINLLKKIRATGCEVELVYNTGTWHAKVRGPGFSVHKSTCNNAYWALPFPSYSFWCPEEVRYYKNPNDAIDEVIDKMLQVSQDLSLIASKARDARFMGKYPARRKRAAA